MAGSMKQSLVSVRELSVHSSQASFAQSRPTDLVSPKASSAPQAQDEPDDPPAPGQAWVQGFIALITILVSAGAAPKNCAPEQCFLLHQRLLGYQVSSAYLIFIPEYILLFLLFVQLSLPKKVLQFEEFKILFRIETTFCWLLLWAFFYCFAALDFQSYSHNDFLGFFMGMQAIWPLVRRMRVRSVALRGNSVIANQVEFMYLEKYVDKKILIRRILEFLLHWFNLAVCLSILFVVVFHAGFEDYEDLSTIALIAFYFTMFCICCALAEILKPELWYRFGRVQCGIKEYLKQIFVFFIEEELPIIQDHFYEMWTVAEGFLFLAALASWLWTGSIADAAIAFPLFFFFKIPILLFLLYSAHSSRYRIFRELDSKPLVGARSLSVIFLIGAFPIINTVTDWVIIARILEIQEDTIVITTPSIEGAETYVATVPISESDDLITPLVISIISAVFGTFLILLTAFFTWRIFREKAPITQKLSDLSDKLDSWKLAGLFIQDLLQISIIVYLSTLLGPDTFLSKLTISSISVGAVSLHQCLKFSTKASDFRRSKILFMLLTVFFLGSATLLIGVSKQELNLKRFCNDWRFQLDTTRSFLNTQVKQCHSITGVLYVSNCSDESCPSTFSLPNLEKQKNGTVIGFNSVLTAASFPRLKVVKDGSLIIQENAQLSSLTLPALESVSSDFRIVNNPYLKNLNLRSLQVGGEFRFEGNHEVSELMIPFPGGSGLSSFGSVTVDLNNDLQRFEMIQGVRFTKLAIRNNPFLMDLKITNIASFEEIVVSRNILLDSVEFSWSLSECVNVTVDEVSQQVSDSVFQWNSTFTTLSLKRCGL